LTSRSLETSVDWVFLSDFFFRNSIDLKYSRTYFFDKTHQRTGISGVLSKEDYDAMFAKILK